MPVPISASRTRPDLCPGVFRPWVAADGALVRLRLVGGRVSREQLLALVTVAEEHGDGRVHLTGRANLQLRGLPSDGPHLSAAVVEAVAATGLLPSRSHELVRNIMVSPSSGLGGGRSDLRGLAADLDILLCASPRLADLPGRFLFVLDDGRGDLIGRRSDLGVVALDPETVQLRVGSRSWGDLLPVGGAPAALVDLAEEFLRVRGTGTDAPWHVDELHSDLAPARAPDARAPAAADRLPYGDVGVGRHVAAPDGLLDRDLVQELVGELVAGGTEPDLVVTPWRGVLVPKAIR